MYFTFADKKSSLLPFSHWSPRVLAVNCATRELYYTSAASSSLFFSKNRGAEILSSFEESNHPPCPDTCDLPPNGLLNLDSGMTAGGSLLNSVANISTTSLIPIPSGKKNTSAPRRERFQWKKCELAFLSPVARDESMQGTNPSVHQLYKMLVHVGAVSSSSPPSCCPKDLLFPSAGPVRDYGRMHESNPDFLEDPFFQRELYERIHDVVAARRRQEETERMRRIYNASGGNIRTTHSSLSQSASSRQMGWSLSHDSRPQTEQMSANRSTARSHEGVTREGVHYSNASPGEAREERSPPVPTMREGREDDDATHAEASHSRQQEEYRFVSPSGSATPQSLANVGNQSTSRMEKSAVLHPPPEVEACLTFSFSCEWEYWRFYYATSLILGIESKQHRPYYGLPPYDPRNGIGLSPYPPPLWCKLKWLRGMHYPYLFVHGNLMGWKAENDDRGSSFSRSTSLSASSNPPESTKTLTVAVAHCYLSVTHDHVVVFNRDGKETQWVELKYVHTVQYSKSYCAPFIVFLTDMHQPDIIFVPTSPSEGTFLGKEREKRLSMMMDLMDGTSSLSFAERSGIYGGEDRRDTTVPSRTSLSTHNAMPLSSSEHVPAARQHTGSIVLDEQGTSFSQPTSQSVSDHVIRSSLSRTQLWSSSTSSFSPLSIIPSPMRRADDRRSPLSIPDEPTEGSSAGVSHQGQVVNASRDGNGGDFSSVDSYARWNVSRLAHILRKTCFGTVEARRVIVMSEVGDKSIHEWTKRRLAEEAATPSSSLSFPFMAELHTGSEGPSHHYDPSHFEPLPPSRSPSLPSATIQMTVDNTSGTNWGVSLTNNLFRRRGKKLDLTLAPFRSGPIQHFPKNRYSMRDAWSLFHSSMSVIRESRDRAPLESSNEVIRASFEAQFRGNTPNGSQMGGVEGAIAVPLYDTLANQEVAPFTPGQVDFARSLLEGEAERDDSIVGLRIENIADLDALEEMRRSMTGVRPAVASPPSSSPHTVSSPSTLHVQEMGESLTGQRLPTVPLPHGSQHPQLGTTDRTHQSLQYSFSSSINHSRLRYFRESRNHDATIGDDADSIGEGGEGNLYGSEEAQYQPAPDIQWINPLQ